MLKDKYVQSEQDSKKSDTKEEKNESVSIPTDNAKRQNGCNRKKCHCAR
ncbi:hypothetical protein PEC301937_12040 [Pectobacterium carotovorum subsp. carotovorum]|nr:hypothetical protein PEC301937_12040 [Pectobacterium carotovorum subsp. carotovorum]